MSDLSATLQEKSIHLEGPLNVAIKGNGFFVLEQEDNRVFSRLGEFYLNIDGEIIDKYNRRLIGFLTDANGDLFLTTGPLSVKNIDGENLLNISISEKGVITAHYQNNCKICGQIGLVSVKNPEKLTKLPNMTFGENAEAGIPIMGIPGTGVLGTLLTGMLTTSAKQLLFSQPLLITARTLSNSNAALEPTVESTSLAMSYDKR